MTADPTAATVALLAGRSSISTLAGTDIYGEELPGDAAFVDSMPKVAIAVQSAGGIGFGDASYLPIGGQRVDVDCYAPTLFEARRLARVAHEELKAVRREVVTYDDENGDPVSVLIHAFTVSSGFVALREPTTEWPRVIRTYTAIYAEQEVAS
jgi:hypothetical protein